MDIYYRRKRIADQVLAENIDQDRKWGEERNQHKHTWMTILGEEYGEACQAALALTGTDEDKGHDYRDELIQVAAVAIAAIECFDRLNEE